MTEAPIGCVAGEVYQYLMDPLLLMDHTEEDQERIYGLYEGVYFRMIKEYKACIKGDSCCMTKDRRERFLNFIPCTDEPYPDPANQPLNS